MDWFFCNKKKTISKTTPKLSKKPQPFPPTLEKVRKQVGQGGCGILDLYQDSITKKKMIVKKSVKNKDRLLLLQYRNLVYLQEKKICSYFLCPLGVFQKDGKILIAFTYLEDYVNLETIVDRDMSFLLNIGKKLVEKLKLLHKNHMVHMDIKPNNIMVNENTGNVRFIDFGGAIIEKPNRSIYEGIVWTQHYLSPEFKQKYKRDHQIVCLFEDMKKNDIWALGMTLLYLFKKSNFSDLEEFNGFFNLSTGLDTNFFDKNPLQRKL